MSPRRLAATPRRGSDDERILPLINVVFLLLIFFMLAGKLTASDPFGIDPPASISDGESGEHGILVLLGADGRLAVNGNETDDAGLSAALAASPSGPSTAVSVKADGRASAATLVATLERIRAAGVEKVRLLTVRGGTP